MRTLRPQTQVNATVNKPIRHQSETELLQITLNRFSNITAASMGILVMAPRKCFLYVPGNEIFLCAVGIHKQQSLWSYLRKMQLRINLGHEKMFPFVKMP